MTTRFAWAAVALMLATSACSPTTAQLSGRWVYASPGGIGVAHQPSYGAPLAVGSAPTLGAPPPAACVARKAIDQHFGKVCAAHETEGGAQATSQPPPLTDEVPLGNVPTPGEAIWYCDAHTVVRVVLVRCGSSDTFGVSQVAVAIEGKWIEGK